MDFADGEMIEDTTVFFSELLDAEDGSFSFSALSAHRNSIAVLRLFVGDS
jgi:hypothetical protein